jgi:hypothetical protein
VGYSVGIFPLLKIFKRGNMIFPHSPIPRFPVPPFKDSQIHSYTVHINISASGKVLQDWRKYSWFGKFKIFRAFLLFEFLLFWQRTYRRTAKRLKYLFFAIETICLWSMTSPMKSLSVREDQDGARAIHSKVSKDKYKCVSNFYFTIKACVKFPVILNLARYNGWILNVHRTDNVSM